MEKEGREVKTGDDWRGKKKEKNEKLGREKKI